MANLNIVFDPNKGLIEQTWDTFKSTADVAGRGAVSAVIMMDSLCDTMDIAAKRIRVQNEVWNCDLDKVILDMFKTKVKFALKMNKPLEKSLVGEEFRKEFESFLESEWTKEKVNEHLSNKKDLPKKTPLTEAQWKKMTKQQIQDYYTK
jgi:hypothetical protein